MIILIPSQRNIEIPLLEVLNELGGEAEPQVIYPLVTKKFPQIRDEDLAKTLPSGRNKWKNRVQWVRQSLILKGEMSSPKRGIWAITQLGIQRLNKKGVEVYTPSMPNFLELYEEYDSSLRSFLLNMINDFSPRKFEIFSKKILQAYGFSEVHVTNLSSDGGIDGYGKLRLGLATMNVAFQCKRWQGNVNRTEVDKFRGAIQGEYEQGMFFITSNFSDGARKVSLKKGAVPIILLNGESIVQLMIEKEIGVDRTPLYIYEEKTIDLDEE